jgi:hypothetical protein
MTRVARLLAALAMGGALLALSTASAATLDISTQRLTARSFASTVPTQTCTLQAAHDTYVDEGSPTANFGSAISLVVQSAVDSSKNARTFVRFDLSACGFVSGSSIQAARVEMHLSAAPIADRTYRMRRLVDTWDEATLTWNTQPNSSLTATADVATGTTTGVTLTYDTTSDIRDFVSGALTNYGWRIEDTVEGSSTTYRGEFRPREHTTAGERPTLVISYHQ